MYVIKSYLNVCIEYFRSIFVVVAPVPRTIMEALEQRRDEFAKRQKEAAAKGEGPKARRLDRVTKVILQ